jgi:hypothetical protein
VGIGARLRPLWRSLKTARQLKLYEKLQLVESTIVLSLNEVYRTRNPHTTNARRKRLRGSDLPPPGMRARSADRASPRLLGIASDACFGAPLGLACVPQLRHAPPRCWLTGRFVIGGEFLCWWIRCRADLYVY